jgi:hypothetical protein
MPDRGFYETAYWRVVSTIEAPQDQLEAMLPELMAAHFQQDFRQEKKIIEKHLPDGTWRWPAYDVFAAERDAGFDDEEIDDVPDYKEMIAFLARRISMIAYNLGREAQLRENVRLHPLFFTWWKFTASGITEIPDKCRQMNGRIFRHDDPVWHEFPPCECLECCCYITATGVDASTK